MRPVQQNRRMRGRGNNNRKGPNPLSRNYESNGPDVKIRGNAQHIAEKYSTLARDAQSAGDRVMAENYLQHAEHYNRIIMAAQAQMPQQFQRDDRDDGDADDETLEHDDVATQDADQRPVNGSGPQPVIEGTPAEIAFGEDAPAEPVRAEAAAVEETTGDGEARPRRQPRPRRPARPKAEKKVVASDDGQSASQDELPAFITKESREAAVDSDA